jgi:hypothetical protein
VTSPGIGGGGFVGIALETVAGTYVAPTKFLAIRSETLSFTDEKNWRRPIRQMVDVLGGVPGDSRVEGDIEMEVTEDQSVYFHEISRATRVKTGSTPNFVYTYTPNALAVPAKTASVTVVRNGQVFAYTGLVCHGFTYSIDNGLLVCTYNLLGRDEATQSLPTPTFPTTQVYGAGQYDVQIPTTVSVFDCDGFEFQVADNGEAQYRLKNTGRGAQFIKYGERAVTLSIARDFFDKTEYASFKAMTAQSVTLIASKGTNNNMTFTLPGIIKDTYEIGLSGQGDLVRAQISYMGTYDATAAASYTVVIKTQENITP